MEQAPSVDLCGNATGVTNLNVETRAEDVLGVAFDAMAFQQDDVITRWFAEVVTAIGPDRNHFPPERKIVPRALGRSSERPALLTEVDFRKRHRVQHPILRHAALAGHLERM